MVDTGNLGQPAPRAGRLDRMSFCPRACLVFTNATHFPLHWHFEFGSCSSQISMCGVFDL